MPRRNLTVILILALISVLYFLAFIPANSAGSENHAMVGIFEPDEGATHSVVDRMTSPKADVSDWLKHFVRYDFYHYGFPFFAISSIPAYLTRWLGYYENLSVLMASYRQFVNVLPMIIAIWILAWLQDRLSSWRSVAIALLLMSVPAVVRNGLWWHPDGLTLLSSVLILWALWKDQRQFGKYFFIAAALTGFLIAMKLVGFYFFLAIAMLLVWGIKEKTLTFKQAFHKGLLFMLVMGVAIFLSNPFMFSWPDLRKYGAIILREVGELSQGYGTVYETGLKAAWPIMREYYGEAVFILLAVGATIYGIIKDRNRLFCALSLAWFIPLTFSLLTTTHFKFQYWFPVAIPLFSNIAVLFPQKGELKKPAQKIALAALAILLLWQGYHFVSADIKRLQDQVNRVENSAEIAFYDTVREELSPLAGVNVKVYYDYRLYLPYPDGWNISTSFDLLDYPFVQENKYDVLLLLRQRIRDYIQEGAIGVDPERFPMNQAFYRDADNGSIAGFQLVYRDDTGLIFVKDAVCEQYFPGGTCQSQP